MKRYDYQSICLSVPNRLSRLWELIRRLGYKLSLISIQTLSISEKNYSTTIDRLPSWNQGMVKERILNFIRDVINLENPKYIPPEDRIAVMDDD